MQTLTLNEVKTACRKALINGTLLAENQADITLHTYGYCIKGRSGNSYHCAIGVALTAETLAEIEDRSIHMVGVKSLISVGILRVVDTRDLDTIIRIQTVHDDWLTSSHEGDSETIADCRAEFVALVA
jgi:hypothetical protein